MGVEWKPWGQKEERKGKRGREEGDSWAPLLLLALKFLTFTIFNVIEDNLIFREQRGVSKWLVVRMTPYEDTTS